MWVGLRYTTVLNFAFRIYLNKAIQESEVVMTLFLREFDVGVNTVDVREKVILFVLTDDNKGVIDETEPQLRGTPG